MEFSKVEALRRQKENLERQRIRKEIEQAQKIQLSLLPGEDPHLPGFQFASMTKPAVEVGGDYYDYIRLSESKLAVAIGDVSGHGIPSGLLMSMAKSSLHTNAEMLYQVDAIMTSLGKVIHQFSRNKMFMSFLFSVIDAEKRELTLAIAGHPPLFHYHGTDRTITEIGQGFYPLGIDAVPQFDEKVIPLKPGDVILYYTDGIPERRNEAGDVFGYERLSDALNRYVSEAAPTILQKILDDLNDFAGGLPADDDMTLIVLKVE
jgi:sigma-B regulation protein RsbU (phosphoserine phosphatase)